MQKEGLRSMKIKELRAGMENITLVARVVEIGEKINVKTRYGEVPLAVAIIEDETGRIRLNLWRQQTELVKVGSIVRIENGFVRSFKNQLEINIGSRGKITAVEE
jgi:replication factor A1